jgi:hypothetical protein
MRRRSVSVIGIILLLAGVGLGVGGLVSRSRTQRFVESAVRGQAQVTGLEQRRGSRSTVMYHPVLRFKTEAGAQHEVVSAVGSSPSPYKPGDTVPILYNPARPQEVRIHSFLHVWLFPIVLGGMGVIFLIVGGVFVLIGR